jgi:hypothetical protein
LKYENGEAKGDVTLPNLPAGKVWWFQPNWTTRGGEARWVTGAPWKPPASPPLERKAASLNWKQQEASYHVRVESKMTSRVRTDEGELPLTHSQTADLKESVVNVGPAGADVRYSVTRLEPHLSVNEQEQAPPAGQLQTLNQWLRQAAFGHRVDNAGNCSNRHLDLHQISPEARDVVDSMIRQLQVVLECESLPLPNREVQPGEKWTAQREVPIGAGGAFEVGALDLSYTYLGSRQRNNRDEAMVGLSGVLRGQKGQEQRMAGRASGTAIIDLASGQMTLARLAVRVDMETTTFLRGPAKAVGTLDVKVTRVLP